MSVENVHDIVAGGPRPSSTAGAARVPAGLTPRLVVVLVLDCSWSIEDRGLTAELNAALGRWQRDLQTRPVLVASAEIAIVAFGERVELLDVSGGESGPGLVAASELRIPPIRPEGVSLVGDALARAMDVVDERRRTLASQSHYVPNIVLISDGEPTDAAGDPDPQSWRAVLPRLREGEASGAWLVRAVGFGDADPAVLREVAGDNGVHVGDAALDRVLSLVSASVDPLRDEANQRFRRVS